MERFTMNFHPWKNWPIQPQSPSTQSQLPQPQSSDERNLELQEFKKKDGNSTDSPRSRVSQAAEHSLSQVRSRNSKSLLVPESPSISLSRSPSTTQQSGQSFSTSPARPYTSAHSLKIKPPKQHTSESSMAGSWPPRRLFY